MQQDTHKTIVVFRKWKSNGDIIALFPYIDNNRSWMYDCLSYEHIGQHSDAWYSHVINVTKPAKPEEYADLLSELTSIGYNLVVRRKRMFIK